MNLFKRFLKGLSKTKELVGSKPKIQITMYFVTGVSISCRKGEKPIYKCQGTPQDWVRLKIMEGFRREGLEVDWYTKQYSIPDIK